VHLFLQLCSIGNCVFQLFAMSSSLEVPVAPLDAPVQQPPGSEAVPEVDPAVQEALPPIQAPPGSDAVPEVDLAVQEALAPIQAPPLTQDRCFDMFPLLR